MSLHYGILYQKFKGDIALKINISIYLLFYALVQMFSLTCYDSRFFFLSMVFNSIGEFGGP